MEALVVSGIIAGAAAYLARRMWAAKKSSEAGCPSGCSCSAAACHQEKP